MNTPNYLIYDASAGSGKTYTLAKEYLKILLTSTTNDAYKKILAITFTNKAVNEMKQRIVGYLKDFTLDTPNEKTLDLMLAISEEIDISLEEIKEKSKVLIKNIIHNYAAFDISTIDKFTHRLIRTFALDLNLPITFEVSLDQKAILQEAVDRILAKAGTDKELTNLLVEFALQKTDDGKTWDFTRDLLEVGDLLSKENFKEEIDLIKNLTLSDFNNTTKKLKEINKNILDFITNKSENLLTYLTQHNFADKAFKGNYFIKYLITLQSGVLKKDLKYHEEEIIVKGINKNFVEDVTYHLPYILEELQSLKIWIGRFFMYEETLRNLTPLSLLNSIAKESALVQKEQNILSIAEFNKIIFEEIQNQPAPYIYEKLGDRYKNFFIDEFQDTSEMQWKNIIPLIDNALAGVDDEGDCGSLMLVGDPKQSIYRWRGGKAEQFIDLAKDENEDSTFSNPNKKVVRLETNYRSYQQVIEFNNDFFTFLSEKFQNPDYKDLYKNKSAQKINSKTGGFVSIEFIPDVESSDTEDGEDTTKNDLYLIKTVETIQKVLASGFVYSDIVLLTRKRSEGVLLANYLIENRIPIISSETLLLSNSDDVNFIINILKLLKNFKDKEARFQVLYYISTYIIPGITKHDFIQQGFYEKDEEALAYYIQQNTSISFNFITNKKKALYEVCEEIVSKFLPNRATVAYVQYFLDIVLEQDMKWQLGLNDFVDLWNKNPDKYSIPSPENANAIQIMTVHKSKGLEFPVVIYPFVEENFARAIKDKLWLDLITDEELPIKRALVRNTKDVALYNEHTSKILSEIEQQQLLDTINVLYVALTRAEEQLYIITAKNKLKAGYNPNNLSTYFVEFLEQKSKFNEEETSFSFGDSKKQSQGHMEIQSLNYIESLNSGKFKSKAIKIALKETLMWGDYREKAIEFGNMVHEILSLIKYPNQINKSLDIALRQGLLPIEFYEPVKYIIENTVNHPDLREHFNPDAKVFNEQNIIKFNSDTIKPDRVTIYKENATLIDYKTGKKSDSHINQLLEYELALKEMGYNVTKKTILYIGDKIEIVNL